MKHIYFERFFYWSLAMIVITLPFPKYSLNSQSIILFFVSWILYKSMNEKWKNLRKMIVPFMLLSSIFWLSLIGLLYTTNFDIASEIIIQNTPFLILPLIIFSTIKEPNDIINTIKLFSFSVIIASIFAIFKALFFKINNLGNFFYYNEFAKILEIHTTYFALFITISIFYFLYDIFQSEQRSSKKWVSITALAYLFIVLYMVSSRISLVALVVTCTLFFISDLNNEISRKKKLMFSALSVLVFYILLISPNFQNRNSGVSEFGHQPPTLSSRGIHWKAVLNIIKTNNILIGNGTGDGEEGLFEEYKNVGFESGYLSKYNAHNQFLENMLFFGILGLVSLLGTFGYLFFQAYKSKDFIVFIIPLIFFIFMITESILVRHSGIILFTLLISFCFVRTHYTKS